VDENGQYREFIRIFNDKYNFLLENILLQE